MKIVIDISKDRYDEIMAMDWKNCRRFFDEEIRAIHDGKVLPKGHGRLIEDTPELERELWTYTRYTGIDEAPYESAVKVIDEAQTIIAACTLADADGGDAE